MACTPAQHAVASSPKAALPQGAWLTLPVIKRLEEEFGKPVITNQVVTVWHVLHLLGCWQPRQGCGRLLLSS